MADLVVTGAMSAGAAVAPRCGLLEQALSLALDHVGLPSGAVAPWRFGPIVIVSAGEDAASAAVIEVAGARGLPLDARAVSMCSGMSLDREIATALAADRGDGLAAELAARRLVVVDRIDRVVDEERRRALVHLLDEALAGCGAWVVSTPVHPATGSGSQLDSRLSGGLIVPLGAHPIRQAAAGSPPTLARIIRMAARLHDVEPAAVVGPSRSRTIAAARSLAMYLARRLTNHSLQAIGGGCGDRDHSTVLHGIRVCAARIARDPAFSTEVDELAALLGGVPVGRDSSAARRPAHVGSEALVRRLRGRRRGRRRLA